MYGEAVASMEALAVLKAWAEVSRVRVSGKVSMQIMN